MSPKSHLEKHKHPYCHIPSPLAKAYSTDLHFRRQKGGRDDRGEKTVKLNNWLEGKLQ